MKLDNYYLIVFESKNHAVLLFTALESKGNNVTQLISTPCSLKAGCTYSLKIPNIDYLDSITSEAKEVGINKFRTYYAKKVNGKINYTKI